MMVVHDISMPALPWSPDRIAVRVAARHLADSPRGPGADPAVAASVDDAVDAPQSWGFSSTVKGAHDRGEAREQKEVSPRRRDR